jgi:hypothetical protein
MSRHSSEQPVIASTSLTALPRKGEAFALQIEVHQPYMDDDGVWRCAATMRPLRTRLVHAAGGDSYQSLCLATGLIRSLLEQFEAEGGTLLIDGTPWPLNAYPMGAIDIP